MGRRAVTRVPGAIEWAVGTQGTERANEVGYAASNDAIRQALGRRVRLDAGADVALHYCYPKSERIFRPRPGKVNVLYTMWESEDLDPCLVDAFAEVDLILTPSRWCARVFERFTDTPIDVVPLGIDTGRFRFRRRSLRPGQRFRWLYLGAPNPRKFTVLPDLYRSLLSQLPDQCELYVKTQGSRVTSEEFLDGLPGSVQRDGPDILRVGNLIVDNRYLPASEVPAIYAQAHGFLALHCGEGFGLTPLEAMATGLAPVISASTGVMEYATEANSYLVAAPPSRVVVEDEDGERREQTLPWPDDLDVLRMVGWAMEDYAEGVRRGRQAARDARQYTWDRTAWGVCSALSRRGILRGTGRRGPARSQGLI
jgi:glycosyltransferase involved in cell wall biosynthesis